MNEGERPTWGGLAGLVLHGNIEPRGRKRWWSSLRNNEAVQKFLQGKHAIIKAVLQTYSALGEEYTNVNEGQGDGDKKKEENGKKVH